MVDRGLAELRRGLGYEVGPEFAGIFVFGTGDRFCQINEFLDTIRSSPAYGDVEDVDVRTEDRPAYSGFGIRTDTANIQTSGFDARSDMGGGRRRILRKPGRR